jgi:hypothetical protein
LLHTTLSKERHQTATRPRLRHQSLGSNI